MNKSGIVLIIIGCVFLANNFGLLQFEWLRQWWPLILIAVGLLLAAAYGVGLSADAAVVACAERNGGRVLTFDRRDFDVIAREVPITLVPEIPS